MKYELIEIKKIDSYSVSGETVYDIEVDEDHSFCVDDNIIVHNSVCQTRTKTGFGVPQLSAIINCSKCKVPIIADGGIKTPGDVVKALAAGATMVMIGGMLSGTDETPGEVLTKDDGSRFKKFRGMASKEAFENFFGAMPDWKTAEGISVEVPYKGPTENVIKDIVGGLRSALTYGGVYNLDDLRRNCEFIEISSSSQIENTTHIKHI